MSLYETVESAVKTYVQSIADTNTTNLRKLAEQRVAQRFNEPTLEEAVSRLGSRVSETFGKFKEELSKATHIKPQLTIISSTEGEHTYLLIPLQYEDNSAQIALTDGLADVMRTGYGPAVLTKKHADLLKQIENLCVEVIVDESLRRFSLSGMLESRTTPQDAREYTVGEAAEFLGKSESSIYNYISRGSLTAHKKDNRQYITPESVARLRREKELFESKYNRNTIIREMREKSDIEIEAEHGIRQEEIRKLRERLGANSFIPPEVTQENIEQWLDRRRGDKSLDDFKQSKQDWWDDYKQAFGFENGRVAQGHFSAYCRKTPVAPTSPKSSHNENAKARIYAGLKSILYNRYDGDIDAMFEHMDEWRESWREEYDIRPEQAGGYIRHFKDKSGHK